MDTQAILSQIEEPHNISVSDEGIDHNEPFSDLNLESENSIS